MKAYWLIKRPALKPSNSWVYWDGRNSTWIFNESQAFKCKTDIEAENLLIYLKKNWPNAEKEMIVYE